MPFFLEANFNPTGDQPRAIERLLKNLRAGKKHQVLLGVTGSGKTFTIANVIAKVSRPTLVISHNKTLAAQLFQEFREFFPKAAVRYFVSYYDYYQPEAYLPVTDTYIEKDAKINEEIDKLRHAATQAVLSRQDVIIIASVSCIYGLGSPQDYQNISLELAQGQKISQKEVASHLVSLQYERKQIAPERGSFRIRGEVLYLYPVSSREIIQIEWQGKKIKTIHLLPFVLKKEKFSQYLCSPNKKIALPKIRIFPAKHFVLPFNKLRLAMANIQAELAQRVKELKRQKKYLEAERLESRTNFDLEMLEQTGYCHGIENYSRHLDFRKAGKPPSTLIDFFNYAFRKDWLVVIDESHMTIPQLRGMYEGDYARKKILVNYGFRLPSALDNRPLKFKEFEKRIPQTIYVSATPGPYELKKATGGRISSISYQRTKTGYLNIKGVVEQLIRPTGLLDPQIEIKPAAGQIKNLIKEIEKETKAGRRVLITTLTKRLAEDIADFLKEKGIKIEYLHAEVKTLERTNILKKLRKGEVDVIVGINLLREGLDLPEVSLVAILDADKEGFLRNETTLIQTMGRAARHPKGRVIMYADALTGSIRRAIQETNRRRAIQERYNKEHNITPRQIKKAIREDLIGEEKRRKPFVFSLDKKRANKQLIIRALEREMERAAQNLQFEKAAFLRDKLKELVKKNKKG